MAARQNAGYSGIQIALHWTIAAFVLFQLIFGESMTSVVDAAEQGAVASPMDVALSVGHYWVGITILGLVVVRLMLRIVQGAPAPAGTSTLTNYAAKAVHWMFYIMLVAVPVTGLLSIYVSDEFGDVHSLGKLIFIILIGLHATGALFHQFFLKDGTLRRMLVAAR